MALSVCADRWNHAAAARESIYGGVPSSVPRPPPLLTEHVSGGAVLRSETTRANLVELLEEMDDRIGAVKLLTAAVRDELMAPVEPPQQQRLAGAYRAYVALPPSPTKLTPRALHGLCTSACAVLARSTSSSVLNSTTRFTPPRPLRLVACRLATMQLKQGEEKAAEESLLSAHEAYKGTLGEAHPATGSTLAAIAHLMRKQGRWQEALPLYESLATVTEDALGPSHPQVGIALRTLAQVRSALGKHAQAVADAEKAATIMRKMHGGCALLALAVDRLPSLANPCAPLALSSHTRTRGGHPRTYRRCAQGDGGHARHARGVRGGGRRRGQGGGTARGGGRRAKQGGGDEGDGGQRCGPQDHAGHRAEESPGAHGGERAPGGDTAGGAAAHRHTGASAEEAGGEGCQVDTYTAASIAFDCTYMDDSTPTTPYRAAGL